MTRMTRYSAGLRRRKNLEAAPVDRTFLEERITKTEALIEAWEDALTFLATHGGIQSYTVDTGQSRQVVTRSDIGTINRTIDSLMNRLSTLEARLNGSGVLNARPGW